MKKFKHKKTGWIAETHYCVPRSYEVRTGEGSGICIPAELIEDSADWQEVTKEPILTTEDGVELFEGDEAYYLEIDDLDEEAELIIIKSYSPSVNHFYFSTREAAEKYRLLNAQKLSISDIYKSVGVTKGQVKELSELVKSRL